MRLLSEITTSLIAVLLVASLAFAAHAQGLWKYTDKDGKVTYSDKAPKDGEKAEPVKADTAGTVIPAERNLSAGKPQNSATLTSRATERAAERENYRKVLNAAQADLEQAKKTLEAGQEPTPEERQIIVGRGPKGQPTGANSIINKPEYYSRIASLEELVKIAEEKVAAAEREYRQKAPQ